MFVVFAVLLGLAQASEVHWVQADVLRLRTAPDAEVHAGLRIGTHVRVLEERGDWARVVVAGRPAEARLEGWVARAFLSDQAPRSDVLRHLAEDEADTATMATLLRRAVALDGGTHEHWARLAEVLDDLDPAAATEARRWGAPDDRVHLAACQGGRAVLLGALEGDDFVALDLSDEDTHARALADVAPLATRTWWTRRVPTAPPVVRGSPFATPFLAPRHSEQGGTDFSAGEDTMGAGTWILALGPCPYPSQDGQLLATAPLHHLDTPPLGWEALYDAHDVLSPHLDALQGLDIADPGPLREIGTTRARTWFGCGGDGDDGEARTLWVARRGMVAAAVGVDAPGDAPEAPAHVAPAHWVELQRPDGRLLIGLATARWNLGEGVVVIVDDGEAVEATPVMLRSFGC